MLRKVTYSIQQMSVLTGLTEHTLRYYERAGILATVRRSENEHRRYSEDDVRRIALINRLHQTGVSRQSNWDRRGRKLRETLPNHRLEIMAMAEPSSIEPDVEPVCDVLAPRAGTGCLWHDQSTHRP